MDKPIPEPREPVMDYNSMQSYIEEKYNVDLRDWDHKYKEPVKADAQYLDYWHWLVGSFNIYNGMAGGLPTSEDSPWLDGADPWILDITKLFREEFGQYADSEGNIPTVYGW